MKKRILSTFLTLALLLTLLPTAVMAEGGQTIYTQSAYTGVDSDGTKDRPFTSFDAALSETKRLGGHNTIVILGGTTQNDDTSTSAPLIIDAPVTIEGRTADDNSGQATFNIRSGGIVLGTDVTMKNVALELTNRYHNAIFVNGHKFAAENVVRGHGSREVHLFAGGLKEIAADSGTNAVLDLRDSQFGNIYAGSMNESYAGNAQINIASSTVGTIYGSGGDDSNYNPDSILGQEEPPAPPAKPNYTVSGPVQITLTNPLGNLTVDGSGANDLAVDVSTVYSTTMALPNVKKLNVTSGTVALSNHSPALDVTLAPDADAAIDLSKSTGGKTIASLSGGGTVMVGVSDTLTIGTVNDAYTLKTLSPNEVQTQAENNHAYITQTAGTGTFELLDACKAPNMRLEKVGTTWRTTTSSVTIPTTVTSFAFTEKSKTMSTEEIGRGEGFIPVKWTSPSTQGTLTMIPFRYQVNYQGKSYEKTAELDTDGNVYSAMIPLDSGCVMELSGQDGDLSGSNDGIAIAGNLTAGTYQISIFAPTAGNGEIEQAFTLTVTNGEENKPQPPAEKSLIGISITTPPTKTDYTVGDVFNPAGMVVTATYSNGSTAEVSGYTTSPTGLLTRSDTSITVSYTEGGVTKTAAQIISVTGKAVTVDMFDFNAPTLTYTGSDQIGAIKGSVALKTDYTDKVGVTTVTVVQNGATVAEAINAGEYEVYVSCTAGTEYDALDKTLLGTVTIDKANYGDRAAAGAAKAGTSGTVDLSNVLVDGSTTEVSVTDSSSILDGTPTISGKALTFKIAPSATTGSTATVEIKVTNANYDPYAIAVTLTVSDKPVPTVTPPTVISGLVYNGQEQALITAGTVPEGCKMLYKVGTGAREWTETVPTGKNAGNYVVSYKVVGNDEYADVAQMTLPWVAIAQKKATIRPKDFVINRGDEIPKFRLAHINFVSGEVTSYSTQPTFECKDTNGQDVTRDTAPGTYPIKWTNADSMTIDAKNYDWTKELTGTLTIKDEPVTPPGGGSPGGGSTGGGSSSGGSGSSGGSSSGGGSSSSDRDTSGSTGKVETTTKPDGSTTKTETKKDGTKVETTTAKDGSTSKTTTNPNGSSVTENKAADGSTGTVKTDKHGQTTAETQLSGKAVETAKKNGEPVKAPVEVEATRNSSTAPTVKVELPRNSGDTKVEIPVSNVKPGTVAVLVHPDGTEEIIKNSVPTEDGIQLTVNGDATVKIVDNSKDFIDTREHWSRDQVNFVAARELFQGVGDNQFGVGRPMTRGMVNTVLARLAGVDTTPAAGQSWYDKCIAWARENGVSDGTNPNGNVTREQLATMLYRYAGSPTVSGTLPFTDTHEANLYAQDALLWAVQNGILNGYGDGRVGPKANAERAQVAAIMARFIQNAQ